MSPYEGERDNALSAAQRIAAKHNMTLEEAAAGGVEPEEPKQQPKERKSSYSMSATERVFANSLHLMDTHLQAEKARYEAALRAAYDRGLAKDNEAPKGLASPVKVRSKKPRGMSPRVHASMLLRETQLSLREISGITGLDIYQITAMKLKLRKPAA
ncbi:hypothetical protein O4H49_09705 [Kiloniella laminariae]|uniref:Uncharacterized protein n=1 Tax=Kiloniella laminariae TaxID=454162 RepID=A0ABT4LM59_9PROT|nr:hypothetical protein [Kiloniella laminariae]MCZ4281052.1 hypothetical protein [Kiloniella laminariae]